MRGAESTGLRAPEGRRGAERHAPQKPKCPRRRVWQLARRDGLALGTLQLCPEIKGNVVALLFARLQEHNKRVTGCLEFPYANLTPAFPRNGHFR